MKKSDTPALTPEPQKSHIQIAKDVKERLVKEGKLTEEQASRIKEPNLEIPVAVGDAWAEAFDLSQGIDDLFYAAACCEGGFSQEAATALCVVSRHLVDQMKIINGYFRPEEDGGQ